MSTSYRYTEPAEATPSPSYQGSSSQQQPVLKPRYPPGFNEYENNEQQANLRPSTQQQQQNQGGNRPGGRVLQKPNRKFTDAYEQEQDPGHHAGTSGAAKRVMDFFRRRGKARSGE
jgi:protein-serine/threonine kinase